MDQADVTPRVGERTFRTPTDLSSFRHTTTYKLQPRTTREVRRRGEPVTFGMPLQPGLVSVPSSLRLKTADGEPVAIDATVLERWPDGSVRWALCHLRANWEAGGNQRPYELTCMSGDSEARPALLIADVSTQAARIDTGVAIFDLRDDAGFLLTANDPRDRASWASVRLRVVNAQGVVMKDHVDEICLETSGAIQGTIVVRGRVTDAHGLSYVIRIQFFHALAAIRVELTICNSRRAAHPGGFWDLGDTGSQLLREAALVMAFQDLVTDVRCSPSVGVPLQGHAAPFEIYQESSGGLHWNSPAHRNREGRVPLAMAGYEIRDQRRTARGARATPVVSVGAGGRSFSVTVPYFWQEFPKSIGVDASHVTVGLLPARFPDLHELQGGEQKTHVLWLGFGPDPVTEIPLDWCRDPLTVTVSPEQFAAAEAVPYMAPAALDPDQRYQRLVSAAVDEPSSFTQKREVVDEYGWRNFGDVYADHEAVRDTGDQPLVSHYNNQYDAVAGFIFQYMRTADVRWWRLCDELARHVVDIDIYHTGEDKPAYSGGMFWHTNHYVDAETSTHRCYSRSSPAFSGGPSAEHNYTTGLLLHFLMTGCVASRAAVLTLAEWVVRMDDGRLTPFRWLTIAASGLASATVSSSYHGPGRGAGNSINALLDAHRLTSEDRWLIKAEELIRRCVHPDDDVESRNLLDSELRWSYTMFLQVLGKYLDYKALLGEFDERYTYAQASLLRYARWMAEHEYPYLEKPDALEFPTETWAAQDMRKSEVFRFAARHALGAERDRFSERSRFFYDYSLTALCASPTRALTRPVVILLTNGYAHGRLFGLFDVQAPDGPAKAGPRVTPRAGQPAFPPPVVFVPQKTIARRRVLQLSVVFCVLAGVAILSLLR
jgi:hypothetical protein